MLPQRMAEVEHHRLLGFVGAHRTAVVDTSLVEEVADTVGFRRTVEEGDLDKGLLHHMAEEDLGRERLRHMAGGMAGLRSPAPGRAGMDR